MSVGEPGPLCAQAPVGGVWGRDPALGPVRLRLGSPPAVGVRRRPGVPTRDWGPRPWPGSAPGCSVWSPRPPPRGSALTPRCVSCAFGTFKFSRSYVIAGGSGRGAARDCTPPPPAPRLPLRVLETRVETSRGPGSPRPVTSRSALMSAPCGVRQETAQPVKSAWTGEACLPGPGVGGQGVGGWGAGRRAWRGAAPPPERHVSQRCPRPPGTVLALEAPVGCPACPPEEGAAAGDAVLALWGQRQLSLHLGVTPGWLRCPCGPVRSGSALQRVGRGQLLDSGGALGRGVSPSQTLAFPLRVGLLLKGRRRGGHGVPGAPAGSGGRGSLGAQLGQGRPPAHTPRRLSAPGRWLPESPPSR